jgi:CPA2 family monovalent cation:H+ antiporter-2
VTRDPILHAAGVERARMLLLTMPDQNTVHLVIERAKEQNAGLLVIARAVREHHVARLRELGVAAAVQPEFEGGMEMVRQALMLSNYDDAAAGRVVEQIRADWHRHVV